MTSCKDCIYFKFYRGTRDRWGIQQEPDDYECAGQSTEEELDRFFSDGEEWSEDAEGCQAFKLNERLWDE